jgi:hypothetical protein
LAGEMPPPSALAGRPSVQMAMEESMEDEKKKKGKNLAGWMWGVMGGKEDREKEEGLDEVKDGDDKLTAPPLAGSI